MYKNLINIILSISLCITSSLEAIAIHFVKQNQRIDVNSTQLIIISDLFKLIVSFILFYSTKKSDSNEKLNIDNIIWFAVPSFIYMLSNNLTFYVLFYLTPSMFNLLSNLKIPITSFLAFLFLHKTSFNIYQFVTIILIFFGNTLAFYGYELNEFKLENIGLILMIFYSLFSGGAAVYSEFVMKYKFHNENIFLQNVKFCISSVFFNFLVLLVSNTLFYWNIESVHFLAIGSMALNGIMASLVIKYIGSIVKTYSTSLSVFVSIIISYLLWDYKISLYFILGVFVSFTGINFFIYDKYSQFYRNGYETIENIEDSDNQINLDI